MIIFSKDGDELLKTRKWGLYKKVAITPMTPAKGPFTVITKEGAYKLPADWEGFIAIDEDGYPYPIEKSVHEKSYERASDRDYLMKYKIKEEDERTS